MAGNISFNSYRSSTNPELQKRLEAQENFTALDKEKLKQDAVELSDKAKNEVNQNGLVKAAKNVTSKDNSKKKLAISIALTVLTTVGLAVIGNKSTDAMAKLGLKVDDLLLNSKWYPAVTGFFGNAKANVVGFLRKHFKTIDDLAETFKTRPAKQKCDLTRGYGNGPTGIHSLTPIDILSKIFQHKKISLDNAKILQDTQDFISSNLSGVTDAGVIETLANMAHNSKAKPEKIVKALQKAGVSGDEATLTKLAQDFITEAGNITANAKASKIDEAAQLIENIVGGKDPEIEELLSNILGFSDNKKTNTELCDLLTKKIAANFGCSVDDKNALYSVLESLKKGTRNSADVDYTDVLMKGEGFDPLGRIPGDWWPTNIINTIGRKIRGNKWKDICKGNLGDSLIKYNAVNGSLAKTVPGKIVQNLIGIPAESISNFYNDKSGLGLFLCYQMIDLYNNAQDAPKEQKVSTVASDFISTMGSWVITMPLAFKATYGLATLKNLEGKGIISKGLKLLGNVFGMGLDKIAKNPATGRLDITASKNIFARVGGGGLRLVLILLVFGSLFRKPVEAITHKIFGKPYNKEEAQRAEKEAQKQEELEKQKNTIIPELGITQGELLEKIQKNPEAIAKMQSDPNIVQKIDANPKLLLDYLDGKDITNAEAPLASSAPKAMSPANSALINSKRSAVSKAPATTNEVQPKKEPERPVDTATYIPSSDFVAKTSSVSSEKQQEMDTIFARADKVLANAEKYI